MQSCNPTTLSRAISRQERPPWGLPRLRVALNAPREPADQPWGTRPGAPCSKSRFRPSDPAGGEHAREAASTPAAKMVRHLWASVECGGLTEIVEVGMWGTLFPARHHRHCSPAPAPPTGGSSGGAVG